jgi:hypothetical protein
MANTPRALIQKRIDKIQSELNDLHVQMNELFGDVEAREFALQELEAVKKTLPEEEGDERQPEIALRKGSDASQARDALRKERKPLHVDDLLRAAGKEVNKKTRASLAGQLGLYARKNQVFIKTGPNEFGLLEWTTDAAMKGEGGLPYIIVGTVNDADESTNGHRAKVSELSDDLEPKALRLDDDDTPAANSNELESAA